MTWFRANILLKSPKLPLGGSLHPALEAENKQEVQMQGDVITDQQSKI